MYKDPFGAAVGIAVLLLIAVLIRAMWRTLKSEGEGARRFRLVAVLCVAALALVTLVSVFGIGVTLAMFAVLVVVAWIVQGFKKS